MKNLWRRAGAAALAGALCLSLFWTAASASSPGFSAEKPLDTAGIKRDPLQAVVGTDPRHLAQALLPVLTQEDVDRVLTQVMGRYSAAGVAVATVENGRLSQCGAWGWAEKDRRAMTADTKIRIASITKVAVGMCAMSMTEEGLLDLDAPLSTYWGAGAANPYGRGQPTARTLMTHTSSLKALDTTQGLARLRALLQGKNSWRNTRPGDGEYWYYNNFGFCILGTTLELAAGRPLDGYFQERFLQPMEIRASLHSGNLEAEELACLYNSSGRVERTAQAQAGQKVPVQIGEGAGYFPGGLTISARDMAKLVCVLAGDGSYDGVQYLSPESVAELETPRFTVTPADAAPFQQCLVLRRQEDLLGRGELYYHTGSAYGVFSLMSYDPETGDGVVVITTGTPRKTDEHGLYALCADLSQALYAGMEEKT